MIRYIGSKVIFAEPFARVDGNGQETPGYTVQYEDGYVSWSPKDVFEKAYRPAVAMSFGMALEALKMGLRVARVGWNGRGMFVYLVPAASYPVQTGAAKEHFGEGSMVPYSAYLAIKNVNETVSTWVPSVNDCLSDDWITV
jgi:hypothetical protein